MTAEKLQDHFAYPPRTFRAEEAARYFSMSISSFLKLVAEGVMPRGIKVRGMTMWDRHELESAWENLKDRQGARRGNPIEEHYGINGEQ
jgi:predicted DNA-binding transcriptional regulator AlpA